MVSQVRFIIKSVTLNPSLNFNDDGYKIRGKLRDLYNEGQQFEIDYILEYLTFGNLKESFFKSFTNPYKYLFKHIRFDYESHADRKKKTIINVNDFNIGSYSFHFISDPMEELKSLDSETITVIYAGLKKSFDIGDLKLNNVEIESFI